MPARFTTAIDLAARIVAGDVTVTDVTAAALDRAEADRFGAFVHVARDRAMHCAELLDARVIEPGFWAGPLFGVPVPIKDLTRLHGEPCAFGSAAITGYVADADDGVVDRLKQAGTVPIGKTSTPEFGLPCYTEPEGLPPAVTPWDPTRMAGGSSGGAAAAVAAGVVPLAHGNDGGGSVRIPASCCGILGMKPSRGMISPNPLSTELGPGLASHGVLARTVTDVAAGLEAMRGDRPGDLYPDIAGPLLAALDQPLGELRVGVIVEPLITDAEVHPEAIAAVVETMERLVRLGHSVKPAPVPFPTRAWDLFAPLWAVGAARIPVPPEREEFLRPLTRWLRDQGRGVTGVQYADAVESLQVLTRQVAVDWWQEFDLIIMPTLAQPPLPVGALRNDADPAEDFAAQTRFTPWTSVQNITGAPAISLPLHHAQVDGVRLPFGVQITAAPYADALVLQVARDLMGGATIEAVPPEP